jgi:Ca2+-binding EF-hand superfamily protein
MKFYDVDGDGNISYDEFIRGLREPLNQRRTLIVKKVFLSLDKDG